jgi:hypothetical protein
VWGNPVTCSSIPQKNTRSFALVYPEVSIPTVGWEGEGPGCGGTRSLARVFRRSILVDMLEYTLR